MNTVPRLTALLAGALSLSACACSPPAGETAAQVVQRCGAPAEIFRAPAAVGELVHEEWRYGDAYVGLIDGSVAYVLK